MSLTLNTNVSSLTTQNWLSINSAAQAKATERLSSGFQLNNAGDDPAGYAIAFKLGVKDAVLQTSINNANQATAMLQVAQGAMQQVGNILTQLKQLATEAASSNNASDLPSLDAERAALQTQIDHIDSSTTYSGSNVFGAGNTFTTTATPTDGLAGADVSGFSGTAATTFNITYAANVVTLTNSTTSEAQALSVVIPTGLNTTSLDFSAFGINLTVNANAASIGGKAITVNPGAGTLTFQVGDTANAANQVAVSLSHVNSATLGLTGDFSTAAAAQTYMGLVNGAITTMNGDQSGVGNAQNQLNYQTANLQTMDTNTQAAESAIKDTNYAKTMSDFTRYQIATQAGVAMLSQADQLPQQILTLLKNA